MVSFTYAWMDSNSQAFYFRTSQILNQFCARCAHSINLTQNQVTSTCTRMFHLCNRLVDLNEVWFWVVHKESWISFFSSSVSHNHCFIYLQHTTDFYQKLITVQKREQGKTDMDVGILGNTKHWTGKTGWNTICMTGPCLWQVFGCCQADFTGDCRSIRNVESA